MNCPRPSRQTDARCSLGSQTASAQQTCPHESSALRNRPWPESSSTLSSLHRDVIPATSSPSSSVGSVALWTRARLSHDRGTDSDGPPPLRFVAALARLPLGQGTDSEQTPSFFYRLDGRCWCSDRAGAFTLDQNREYGEPLPFLCLLDARAWCCVKTGITTTLPIY